MSIVFLVVFSVSKTLPSAGCGNPSCRITLSALAMVATTGFRSSKFLVGSGRPAALAGRTKPASPTRMSERRMVVSPGNSLLETPARQRVGGDADHVSQGQNVPRPGWLGDDECLARRRQGSGFL